MEKVKCHGNSSGVQLDVGERLGKGWGVHPAQKLLGTFQAFCLIEG